MFYIYIHTISQRSDISVCQYSLLLLNLYTKRLLCTEKIYIRVYGLIEAVLRIRIRDSGSDAFLTPGSGIRTRFFPDPGSLTHIFESLVTIFWVKSSIFVENWPKFFSSALQN
jgi:hypothetical protein